MVLYEVENAFVFYERQYDLITFKWVGKVSDEEYKTAVTLAYEKTEEFGVTRWLTDSRFGVVASKEAQEWIITDFVPNYLNKTTLRRVAYVVADNYNRKEYVNRLKSIFKYYQIEVFDDVEIAKKWLTRMYSKKEDIENELRRQTNS